MKFLKDKILYCLDKFPQTRNSDIKLCNAVWIEYYQGHLFKNERGQWAVELLELYNIPKEDDVRRIRAKIQNIEHKFLPTVWEVAKQRKIKEEEWRSFLGYNPELREV